MAPPLARDDGWKPRPSSSGLFKSIRLPRRTRRRTLACWALLIVALYYLFRPSEDVMQWDVPTVPSFLDYSSAKPIPIRFPKLYKSQQGVHSGRRRNNNVLYAAANLTAASKMAGIACEMATYKRSEVHMAIMGFDTLEIEEFKVLNGLAFKPGEDGCQIHFHDARAHNAVLLPLERRKIAIKSVFRHLGTFMHPQAVIIDPSREEHWFVEIAKEKAGQLGLTLIELPESASDDLRWITRLDSLSLNAWHRPTFEIVVHANAHIGNLERLLRSIESASYPSKDHRPTRITVVLDPSVPVHPFTRQFLQNFEFPGRGRVSVQRSVLASDEPMEKAAQFVQSFYGVSEHHSVLFLDPDVELSRWYYHFLLYTTFEYRYSHYYRHETTGLFGISLESPTSYPSGKPFDISDLDQPLFLHPAPSSRAALYFSDHWSEFHSYFSHRLLPEFEVLPHPERENTAPAPKPLELSKKHVNSWTGSFIELARAREYVMLYPSLSEPLAIVHTETIGGTHRQKKPHAELRLLQQPFPDVLPEDDLPEWNQLPVINLWGERSRDLETDGLMFRAWISTCPNDMFPSKWGVEDLFCDEEGRSV